MMFGEENENGGRKDEESIDPELVITHLRDLVSSYEDLVKDMTITINKTKEDFELCQKDMRGELTTTTATSPSTSSCKKCAHSRTLIDNLRGQVEAIMKGKKLATALWYSSTEQIEELERRLKQSSMQSDLQLRAQNTDSQMKLLQSYIVRLEGRIEQSCSEKNFYRRKLMEAKLENESKVKSLIDERQKQVDLVKSTYLKEIEHLKQSLERERSLHASILEKKLEEERKLWLKEERERKEQLKKTWLSQLEPLLVEQEAGILRESQLEDKLRQAQMELFQAKQLLLFSSVSSPLQQQRSPQQQYFNGKSPVKSSHEELYHTPEKSSETQCTRKHCDYEECIKYSTYEKVLFENERLGDEIGRLQKCKQTLEKEYEQRILRLEQRIRDLEQLNYGLQSKLLDHANKINDFYESKQRLNEETKFQDRPVKENNNIHKDDEYLSKTDNHQYQHHDSPRLFGHISAASTPVAGSERQLSRIVTSDRIRPRAGSLYSYDKFESFSRDVLHKVDRDKWKLL